MVDSGHLLWPSVGHLSLEDLESWPLDLEAGEEKVILPPTSSFKVRDCEAVHIGWLGSCPVLSENPRKASLLVWKEG